jgi:hypothetical protein
MKNMALVVVTLLFVGVQAKAQSIKFEGKVSDSISRQSINFTTISLLDSATSKQINTLSNGTGEFSFQNLFAGSYKLTLVAIGYHSKIVKIKLKPSQSNSLFYEILLSPKNINLKEVTINGVKPLVKQEPDRIVYDIAADPDHKNENMLQMMRKIPFLSLDAEDNLLMKGSTDYKVLVDGRSTGLMARSPKDALRMLSANTVKKVEVITSPSAKYDSEGAAGIINIITNKNLVGATLYTLLHANTRIGRGFESAVTVKKGKVGLYIWSGYWRHDIRPNFLDNVRTNLNTSYLRIQQQGKNKIDGGDFPINADFSYAIDTLNLLNISYARAHATYNDEGNQFFSATDQQGSLSYAYSFDNTNYRINTANDIGLNYQLGFRRNKNSFLTLSYRFSRSTNEFQNLNLGAAIFNYTSFQTTQDNIAGLGEQTVQLDYSTTIKKVNIESGAKLIFRDNFSLANTDYLSGGTGYHQVDDLDYQQNIAAAYQSFRLNLKKWGFKTGVRLERTGINAQFISTHSLLNRDFINLIPVASLSHKITSSLTANLAYTQRIQRPAIWQLNPFVNQSNPLQYSSGNPSLNPAIFHLFEMGFSSFKKTTFTVNFGYAYAHNTIQAVTSSIPGSITKTTFENIGKNENLSLNISANRQFNTMLSMYLNWRVQYVKFEGSSTGFSFENKGFMASGSPGINLRFPNDFRISGSLNINTSQPILQGRASGNVMSVINFKKLLLDKKMNISLQVYSPIKKNLETSNLINAFDFTQQNSNRRTSRGFYLGINYTFGELKERIKKTKSVSNDDLISAPKEN